MKLLFVLLAMMTWTVESKNSVRLTDDSTVPYDIEVSYANTYNKGQVLAGDVATLTLSHMDGIMINGIEVYVKSNKSGGAGTFTVTANGQTTATKTGTFKDWFGAYDNENYHALSLLTNAMKGMNDLSITLVGSANSLHIEKYVISWTTRPAHTVTLMNGSRVYATLTEEAGMQGVLLPSMPDTAQWQFIGWSSREFWETPDELYMLYPAGERFYMNEDRTLWATYRFKCVPEEEYMTDLESGVYQYVNRAASIALTGVPEDGWMEFDIVKHNAPEQYYAVTFASPDTAYIVHEATGTPIGYSGTDMAAVASPWLVYHDGEETLFYMTSGTKTYVLWLNIMDAYGEIYAGLMQAKISGGSPMSLMHVALPCNDEVTCHPGETQGIGEVTDESLQLTGERVLMHFGNYDLMIKDGQKYIRKK